MNYLVIFSVFIAAFATALLGGIRLAFVCVYLPAMILLNQLALVDVLPHVPLSAAYAPLWAILFALPFRGDSVRFKVGAIDVIVFALAAAGSVTGWLNENFEGGVNAFRSDLMNWTLPYFMGRLAFQDWRVRRTAVNVLIAVMGVVTALALIEARFAPYFYLHLLSRMGMGNHIQTMAYYRFGLNRVSATVEHPIYFGNMCLGLLGLIAALAATSGVRLTRPMVALTLAATGGCLVLSLSFTPYAGLAVGVALLAVMAANRFARLMILPLTLAIAGGLCAFTFWAALLPLGPKPESELGGSLYTRKVIMHESWPVAKAAGWFGLGRQPDFERLPEADEFSLASVDNSYMQFVMTRGWLFLTMWTSIGFIFAWRATRAFLVVRTPGQVFPLAVVTATVLALMVSMYTVWAGALYTTVWFILIGLSNTLFDAVLAAAAAERDGRRRGFAPVVPPGVRLRPVVVPPRAFA